MEYDEGCMQDFLDKIQAEEIIRSEFPNANKIKFVDHGYNNLIAKIDEDYIFRSPKNVKGQARFEFGITVLEKLIGNVSLSVPKLVKKNDSPQYSIFEYLPGSHLDNKAIRSLGEQTLFEIGSQLANFSIELNKVFSPDSIKSLRAKTGLDKVSQPWDVYMEEIFCVTQENPKLEALNQRYYAEWKNIIEDQTREIVIHDDLHSANLLFEQERLTGILDFEELNVGTVEQEFCDLFRLCEEVLVPAVQKYKELTGHDVNIATVKTWAITAELAAYSRQINKQDPDHPSFKRAESKLRYWLGDDFPF